MADHDRPDREADPGEDVERVQRHPGDDPGQGDRQQEQERDRLAAEEAEAVDRRRRHRPEHERDAGREERDPHGEPDRPAHVRVAPRDAEPVRRPAGDRPALDVGGVEGVHGDDHERDPEEEDDQQRPQAQRDPRSQRLHRYRASNAPSRFATRR